MSFVNGDTVLVEFPQNSGEWVHGHVMSSSRGYVMAHIDRPPSLRSLPNMAGPNPIVCVKDQYVKPIEEKL